MQSRIRRLLAIVPIAILAITAATAAYPAGNEEIVDRDRVAKEINQAWKKADWDALDRLAAAVVGDYEREPRQFAPYRTFFYLLPRDNSLPTQEAYGQWSARHPDSFAAHYARSRYYSYLAMYARGGKFIAETPRLQLQRMREWFALAQSEALASLKLSSRATLSYFQLMRIARYVGDETAISKYYEAAVAVDPDVLMLAEERLYSLQPRWGGDFLELARFPDEAARHGLSAAKVVTLRRLALLYSAWDMALYGRPDEAEAQLKKLLADASDRSYRDAALLGLVDIAVKRGDIGAAIKATEELAAIPNANLDFLATAAYRLAKKGRTAEAERYYKICLDRNPKYYYALMALARSARDAKRPQDALGYYDRVLASWPENGSGLSERGWLRVTASIDAPRGVEDLRRASVLGEAFAQNYLGYLSWEGQVVRKDPAEAIFWWLQSADQGNRDASGNLKMAESRLGSGYWEMVAGAKRRQDQEMPRKARVPSAAADAPPLSEVLDPGLSGRSFGK